jgi:hypothetical protein
MIRGELQNFALIFNVLRPQQCGSVTDTSITRAQRRELDPAYGQMLRPGVLSSLSNFVCRVSGMARKRKSPEPTPESSTTY